MDTIYIERDVMTLPQTQAILAKYPNARQVPINRYTEVFNAPAQNFRTQKNNPALILAHKHGKRVLATPPGYHIGGEQNYYFSHMFNCIYDCRYCFLQGMYRSANYVVFVNYDDFFEDIKNQTELSEKPTWYFSGYDCDSLALEPMTHFIESCLDAFSAMPKAMLEIRTKSTQIRNLLARPAIDNCVVAYSLSPSEIVSAEEHKTPSLAKRIAALKSLQENGWKIGLRFDPLLKADNFEQLYSEMFELVFSELNNELIHSVSLGPFRLPKPFFKKMIRLYPESKLLAANMSMRDNMLSYDEQTESHLLNYCETQLQNYISPEQYFPCVSVP